MPLYYRLSNPDISSLSVDGFEHKVNPATGLLEIEMMTPNLVHDLEVVRGAVRLDEEGVKEHIAQREAEAKARAEAEARAAQAAKRATKDS